MKKSIYQKVLFISIFLGISVHTFSLVGIGTTTPAQGSMLDIESSDKGL